VIPEVRFAHPGLVHLAWAAAGLLALLVWLEGRGQGALARVLSALMQTRLVARVPRGRRIARLCLVGGVLGFGIGALMRPQTAGGNEAAARGRTAADVVVVLDVSRSMLAADAAPSRLLRAKADVMDLVGQLEGARLGLVAFAGRATLICPLTPDQAYFQLALRGVDTSSVTRGGTHIGAGIREALRAFDAGGGAKLILLITDGEDHDSYPLDAAKQAQRDGVRIVSIGFGSEQGAEIPLPDPQTGAVAPLRDSGGNVVRSRLDGETLRQIALATGGAYVPARTGALDLESIVSEHIAPLTVAEQVSERAAPVDQYQWLLAAALACLLGAAWLGRAPRLTPAEAA